MLIIDVIYRRNTALELLNSLVLSTLLYVIYECFAFSLDLLPVLAQFDKILFFKFLPLIVLINES